MRILSSILAFVLVACVDPNAGATSELSGSVGVLHVERSAQAANRTTLRAAFARYQGIDGDQVLELIGSGSPAPLGECTLVTSEQRGVEDADVELLDVGALRVSVADTEARLSPRAFPDLASVLAGVFYAGDAALAMPRPEVDHYVLDAEGSDSVGPFAVEVMAPAEPSGLALVGADGTSAVLTGTSVPEVRRSGTLTLVWEGGDARDSIEIELAADGATLACSSHDEGSFRISAAALASLGADSDASLSVRRVRFAPFDAPGIDVAYARVAAVRTVPLALR